MAIKNAAMEILEVKCAMELPNDVQMLFHLLSNYKDGDEILIENHPRLLTEKEKISLFNDMYTHV